MVTLFNCLTIDAKSTGYEYVGFFGCVAPVGQIMNLKMVGVSISADGSFVGGLAGVNRGVISNCEVLGDIDGGDFTGGLVGLNTAGSSVISDSLTRINVKAPELVGGLVGVNKGSVVRCATSGSVSGTSCVGGLIGDNTTALTVSDCYSLCTISGHEFVGGIAGENSGNILYSYAAGRVDGNDFAGALVGEDHDPDFVSCFWDSNINSDVNGIGNGSDPNVVGLTTVQMQQRSTFTDAGWDFINVWDIGENQTYPFLRTHLPSDINKDDKTNFYDIAILAGHWLDEK